MAMVFDFDGGSISDINGEAIGDLKVRPAYSIEPIGLSPTKTDLSIVSTSSAVRHSEVGTGLDFIGCKTVYLK